MPARRENKYIDKYPYKILNWKSKLTGTILKLELKLLRRSARPINCR